MRILPVVLICRRDVRLRRRANQWPQLARLALTRGAYRDRHGRRARDAMACWRARRAPLMRTAKSCGPGAPTLASSFAVMIREATVAKKPGTPRRARISRQTNRAGNAGCFGVPVVTCLRAFFICTQGCGCVRCTGIPCALFFVRDEIDASLGREARRGNAASCPVIARSVSDEAIQTVSAEAFWIASLRSQ
jgi:hypothetical protein